MTPAATRESYDDEAIAEERRTSPGRKQEAKRPERRIVRQPRPGDYWTKRKPCRRTQRRVRRYHSRDRWAQLVIGARQQPADNIGQQIAIAEFAQHLHFFRDGRPKCGGRYEARASPACSRKNSPRRCDDALKRREVDIRYIYFSSFIFAERCNGQFGVEEPYLSSAAGRREKLKDLPRAAVSE